MNTSGVVEEFAIEVAPTWDAREMYGHLTLKAPGIAPCPYGQRPPDVMSPSGLSFDLHEPIDADHVAEQIVAGLAAGALHEGLEWVRINGVRLAEPHTHDEHNIGNDNVWDWLVDEMTALVKEYRRRYPLTRLDNRAVDAYRKARS